MSKVEYSLSELCSETATGLPPGSTTLLKLLISVVDSDTTDRSPPRQERSRTKDAWIEEAQLKLQTPDDHPPTRKEKRLYHDFMAEELARSDFKESTVKAMFGILIGGARYYEQPYRDMFYDSFLQETIS